jgi:hypothetical protein
VKGPWEEWEQEPTPGEEDELHEEFSFFHPGLGLDEG